MLLIDDLARIQGRPMLYTLVHFDDRGRVLEVLPLHAPDDVYALLSVTKLAASWADCELRCGDKVILHRKFPERGSPTSSIN